MLDHLSNSLKSYIFDDLVRTVIIDFVSGNLAVHTGKCLLLQALLGGGKTSILKLIAEAVGHEQCIHIDLSSVTLSDRGFIEEQLLNARSNNKHFLLLDNVDYLYSSESSVATQALTLSSPSITSALKTTIDNKQCNIIATCTNSKYIDSSLLQPYRLGSRIIKLQLPDINQREKIVFDILSTTTIELIWDYSPYNTIQTLSKEISIRTNNYNTCDLYKLVKDLYQKQFFLECNRKNDINNTIKLPVKQLLQEISLINSNNIQNISKDNVLRFVRTVDYDTKEPILMGLEPMQQQLVECITTLIPSFHYNDATLSNHAVYNQRKCSGIVLHGPSGSGKTALCDWLAHITRRHCRFMSVPCADLVHKVVGETERKLSEIFQAARELSPCIVLLDNIDMLLGVSGNTTTDNSSTTGNLSVEHNLPPGLPAAADSYTSTAGDPGNTVIAERPGRRKLVIKNQSKVFSSSVGTDRHKRDLLPPPPGAEQPAHLQRRQFRSARTRHQAVDRMLSTLLVEIDGIYTTSSSSHSSTSSSSSFSQTVATSLLDPPSVLVIATTSTMDCMDRALVRPGRLEEHIALSLPSCPQRHAYILHLLQQQLPASPIVDASELSLCGPSVQTELSVSDRMTECAILCSKAMEGRSYAHIHALYQEANIAYARGLFASGLGLTALQTAQYWEKLEFILNYMTNPATPTAAPPRTANTTTGTTGSICK